MKPQINELLAKFALDENHTAISQAFFLKNKVNVQDQRKLYKLISTILRGYIFADLETQEIVEILGESNASEDSEAILSHAIDELNRRDKERNRFEDADSEKYEAEAA